MTLKFGANLGLLSGGAPGEEHYDEIVAQWRGFDALVQGSVTSAAITSPPVSPSNGDCYIIPAGATGAWSGKTNQIARWTTDTAGSQWEYYTPRVGWKLFNVATGQDFRYGGSGWAAIDGGVSYEQGSFGASGLTASPPVTITYNADKCRYTKIGTRVWFDIHFEFDYDPTLNARTFTAPLPYAVKTETDYVAKVNGVAVSSPTSDILAISTLTLASGATTITVGTTGYMSGGDAGVVDLVISGSYETN